jgi:hypothetical protein
VKLSKEDNLSKTLSGVAGEYFVAAELCRHGMVAAVTLRNTRGIDIIATRPDNASATIQVKTVQKGGAKWMLNESDEKSRGPNHYYVFVILHGRDGQPEYWIVEADYVARYLRNNHQKWMKRKRRDGGMHKDSSMRIFGSPEKQFHNGWERILRPSHR